MAARDFEVGKIRQFHRLATLDGEGNHVVDRLCHGQAHFVGGQSVVHQLLQHVGQPRRILLREGLLAYQAIIAQLKRCGRGVSEVDPGLGFDRIA